METCQEILPNGELCGNELFFKVKPGPLYILHNLCYNHAILCPLHEIENNKVETPIYTDVGIILICDECRNTTKNIEQCELCLDYFTSPIPEHVCEIKIDIKEPEFN